MRPRSFFPSLLCALVALALMSTLSRAEQAPFCPPDQEPEFLFGFADMQAILGEVMGDPLECEHTDPESGDALQTTTTGLASYRAASNIPTFTNGYEHWAIADVGVLYWTGEDVDPPETAENLSAPPPEQPLEEPDLHVFEDPRGRTRIPSWLQAEGRIPLYVDHDSSRIATRVSQHTFLKVVGAGAYRLQVHVEADATRPAASGWVDPFDVSPSEPGEAWLRVAQPGRLFASAGEGARVLRPLASGTRARRTGESVGERVPVRVYSDDLAALASGWIDASAVQPTPPPNASVIVQRKQPAPPGPYATNAGRLIQDVAAVARALKPSTGIPVATTIAQAILESAWGESLLAREANNYLGIKAFSRLGNNGVVWFVTQEFDEEGGVYQTLDPFRAYKSLADCVADHHALLRASPGYRAAVEATTGPRDFAHRLQATGYSTDPDYADKLIRLMDELNLYRFDG